MEINKLWKHILYKHSHLAERFIICVILKAYLNFLHSYYVSDPYNHRQLREALTYQEISDHVNHKATRLLTMGNALHESSLPYLRSYLNDSDAHILLKCAAVEALGNYPHKEV